MFYQVHVLIVTTSDTHSRKEYSDNEYCKIYKNFDDFFKNNSKGVNCEDVFPIFLSVPHISGLKYEEFPISGEKLCAPSFQE